MKKNQWRIWVCAAAAALAGCNDSSQGVVAPGAPNLGGDNWSGTYVAPGQPTQTLTAEISQYGRQLVISTSKSGVGAFFTGSIDEDGVIRLTDGFDGETWTSYGEVSGNYIRIRDYLMNLGEAGGDIPEQDIYLRR